MTDEEVREITERARQNAAAYAHEDPIYAEVMATYAVMGELLLSGRTDMDYAQDLHDVVNRLIRLGDSLESEAKQRIAVMWAHANREVA